MPKGKVDLVSGRGIFNGETERRFKVAFPGMTRNINGLFIEVDGLAAA